MSSLNDPRVLFAAERTLLAWNRTSLSLITFGFFVDRSGLMLQLISPELGQKQVLFFWLGIAFIALGCVCALYSTRQYAQLIASLNPAEFPPRYGVKRNMAANIVVAVLGIVLMVVLSV
jgi:putative membrane protein